MLTCHARIETDRASRYLVQFCKHAAAMGAGGHSPRIHNHAMMARRDVQVRAEWDEHQGTVTLEPWGTCALTAEEDALTVQVEARDTSGLRRIQDVVTRDLDRFSKRAPLTVTWQGDQPRRRRRVLFPLLVSLALALAAALHLGAAGAVVANSRWTGLATNTVLVVVVVKVGLVIAARTGLRRRKAAKAARKG